MGWITDRVCTAAMMREMDRKAIEEHKIPGVVLMENAGRGAFEFIREEYDPRRVVIFAGKGNNGGDGFVIARHLLNAGVSVHTFVLAKQAEIKGDARVNLEILHKMEAPVLEAMDVVALEDYRHLITQSDLIVDAILGTGLASEVTGLFRKVIEFINGVAEENPELTVVAVDLPSGVNADSGEIMGAAITADATATFGALKTGHLNFPGAALTGTLCLLDISLPRALYAEVPYRLITPELAADLLPYRSEDCHKGNVGHGLVLAGSPGKTGAAVMAAESALRSGAGLITLAGPARLSAIFETKTLEVMTEALPDTDEGAVGAVSLPRALELIAGKSAAALGPGLGRGPEVAAFVSAAIEKSPAPLVIDADGLTALAENLAVLGRASAPVILTPHPGEMARLIGADTKSLLRNRLDLALGFARRHRVVLVLKGAHTVVALPDGQAFFNLSGNPGMASGGTGDVLTGVILGLLCQGLAAPDAAVLGVFIHGMAGDLAAEERGEEGLIAGDIMDRVPEAIQLLRETSEE